MKILIVNTDFDIGGGELSLVGFLNNIDLTKYEVSLGLLQPKIGLCDKISPKISIVKLYENPSLPFRPFAFHSQKVLLCYDFLGALGSANFSSKRVKRAPTHPFPVTEESIN